jgi:hypothetical protein
MSEQQIDYAWRCAELLAENGTLKNNLAAANERAELAEKQRDAAVEGLEDDLEEIEPAIYILQTSPKECLGITGDDFNSWPIRDELISNLKKRVKENRDTIARIREMGEKGVES